MKERYRSHVVVEWCIKAKNYEITWKYSVYDLSKKRKFAQKYFKRISKEKCNPLKWDAHNSRRRTYARSHTHTQGEKKASFCSSQSAPKAITEKYVTNLECSSNCDWFDISCIFHFGPHLSISLLTGVNRENRVSNRARTRIYTRQQNSAFHLNYERVVAVFFIVCLSPSFCCRYYCVCWVDFRARKKRKQQPSDKLFMTYEHNGIHDSNIPKAYR